jgi:hypothetical protein
MATVWTTSGVPSSFLLLATIIFACLSWLSERWRTQFRCIKCDRSIYVVCGTVLSEEGYGSKVLCPNCMTDNNWVLHRSDNQLKQANMMVYCTSMKLFDIWKCCFGPRNTNQIEHCAELLILLCTIFSDCCLMDIYFTALLSHFLIFFFSLRLIIKATL